MKKNTLLSENAALALHFCEETIARFVEVYNAITEDVLENPAIFGFANELDTSQVQNILCSFKI